ncbi:hypothetical protein K491DRAFT_708033 [Lophiostoma macrostomum CBS 122681]|uniref:DUF8212 domain-containing protein n=1 Tax=Lophiostoma macrostomum CBS 122681 TaxID=1314788 RepID=A0A6A6SP45_9PLEO|nr:hypothetical protein K491DRAFT_708033 [Lophiostoma macrostomum CBS 122681]
MIFGLHQRTSTSELSEAIHSVYRYYKRAKICFAHLADVELISPSQVDFFNSNWQYLGSKHHLCNTISQFTGIESDVLRGCDPTIVPVARRMSWAANRVTTRVEDRTYCLLGIFDVNKPLLYGEGKKAFIRLQEEMMKISHDHSLFAWGLEKTTTDDE